MGNRSNVRNGILERERRRDRRPPERGGGRPLGNDGTHHSGTISIAVRVSGGVSIRAESIPIPWLFLTHWE